METITLEVSNLVSFAQGARLLGCARSTIYNLVAAGKLHPLNIGSSRFLLRDEVERFKAITILLAKRE